MVAQPIQLTALGHRLTSPWQLGGAEAVRDDDARLGMDGTRRAACRWRFRQAVCGGFLYVSRLRKGGRHSRKHHRSRSRQMQQE